MANLPSNCRMDSNMGERAAGINREPLETRLVDSPYLDEAVSECQYLC